MREQSQEHRDLRQSDDEIGSDREQMAALGDPETARDDSGNERQQRADRDRRDDELGPFEGGEERQRPS